MVVSSRQAVKKGVRHKAVNFRLWRILPDRNTKCKHYFHLIVYYFWVEFTEISAFAGMVLAMP